MTTSVARPSIPAILRTHPHALKSLLGGVAQGAVVALTLDAVFSVIAYVVVLDRYSIVETLQYIASGLLGTSAFEHGLVTAGLGVAIHSALAFGFAGLYAVVVLRVAALRKSRGILSGLLFGAAVWVFMALVVLPRSGVPQTDEGPLFFWAFLLDHAFLVGLPIALFTHAGIHRHDARAL